MYIYIYIYIYIYRYIYIYIYTYMPIYIYTWYSVSLASVCGAYFCTVLCPWDLFLRRREAACNIEFNNTINNDNSSIIYSNTNIHINTNIIQFIQCCARGTCSLEELWKRLSLK